MGVALAEPVAAGSVDSGAADVVAGAVGLAPSAASVSDGLLELDGAAVDVLLSGAAVLLGTGEGTALGMVSTAGAGCSTGTSSSTAVVFERGAGSSRIGADGATA